MGSGGRLSCKDLDVTGPVTSVDQRSGDDW